MDTKAFWLNQAQSAHILRLLEAMPELEPGSPDAMRVEIGPSENPAYGHFDQQIEYELSRS
jgi:hypothetical protein